MRMIAVSIVIGALLISAGQIFGNRYGVINHSMPTSLGGVDIVLIYDKVTGSIEACAVPAKIESFNVKIMDLLRDDIGCRRVR